MNDMDEVEIRDLITLAKNPSDRYWGTSSEEAKCAYVTEAKYYWTSAMEELLKLREENARLKERLEVGN